MATPEPRLPAVWVFIDSQNFYNDARRAFYPEDENHPGSYGQVKPWALGELLIQKRTEAGRPPSLLERVKVYKGIPSTGRDTKAYAAYRRQRTAWERENGVEVFGRSLSYPEEWPASGKPTEKGIDVALAIDLLYHGIRRNYQVAIVASTDTDLVPALVAVCEQRRAWGRHIVDVEVVCFEGSNKRLRVDGEHVRGHTLSRAEFESVEDLTNYTLETKKT